ncbi:MFS transporter [Streptomyces cinnamoneus]|uniref:MFS transporter n=1 Tax=Streptomyces cinnamoneus TaxID=53446 RepID=UPI0037AAEECF
MSTASVVPTTSVTAAPVTPAGPAARRQVPVGWLAVLAAPIAMGANAPVLIMGDLARSLGVAQTTATWLVTSFAWAMTVGTPLFAALLRQRGARPVLLTGSALVAAGTLLVTLAPWLPLALVGRAGQALGGAGLVAVAMNLAGSARRMGVITAGFGMLGASGPLLGSLLAGAVSGRLALALSAVALFAVPAVWRRAEGTSTAPGAAFDPRGASLVVALVSALVLLPTVPLAAAGAAVVVAALLAVHVRRRPEGFVPAALLRSRTFLTSALFACTVSTSYFALLFSLPRLIARRTDWSTGAVGTGQLLALLAGAALSWLLAAASGRLGHRRVLALLAALGALAPLTAALADRAPLLLLAATAAVFVSTSGNAVLSVRVAKAAPAGQSPTAIGLFVLCYQLGGALGPALAATLVLS